MKLAQWLALAKLARHALKLGLHHFINVQALPSGGVRRLMAVLQKIFAAPSDDQAKRLCATVESLGPVYIKLGQLFSTRRDLLPGPIVDALCKLQDQVDPIDAFAVSDAVSEHLGQPTSEVFRHIEAQPLASASIAQVHAATLLDGSEVVIKLVRPGISQRIHEDMHTLEVMAEFLCRNSALARRLHLDQVMRDHHAVLTRELDMFAEGRNQIQLRRNFADSLLLYVPKVYSQLSRRHMLVMERVYGVPIGQIDTLRAAGVDFQVLAHKGVETFFTQVFDHNFFHADMHPGNIQVDISNPADPSYIALDCAIVG
ncbi:MAG: AarF/UbiB family protein, partial [Pseudomonadota bacterium]|nr:AarF/UbiB family protein [Pseudomonadota bacterium]